MYQKNKALREFKQDEVVRVILLCSARAASGTNLMEASHVVLMGMLSVVFFFLDFYFMNYLLSPVFIIFTLFFSI